MILYHAALAIACGMAAQAAAVRYALPRIVLLLLIGVALVAESFDLHIPKGYIYFAMAFSIFVEMLNMKLRRRRRPPVRLRRRPAAEAALQRAGAPVPEDGIGQ